MAPRTDNCLTCLKEFTKADMAIQLNCLDTTNNISVQTKLKTCFPEVLICSEKDELCTTCNYMLGICFKFRATCLKSQAFLSKSKRRPLHPSDVQQNPFSIHLKITNQQSASVPNCEFSFSSDQVSAQQSIVVNSNANSLGRSLEKKPGTIISPDNCYVRTKESFIPYKDGVDKTDKKHSVPYKLKKQESVEEFDPVKAIEEDASLSVEEKKKLVVEEILKINKHLDGYTAEQFQCEVKLEPLPKFYVPKDRDDENTGYLCQCNHCGLTFTSKVKLLSHIRRHFNYKPHKCTICDRSYYEADDLKMHMMAHKVSEQKKMSQGASATPSPCSTPPIERGSKDMAPPVKKIRLDSGKGQEATMPDLIPAINIKTESIFEELNAAPVVISKPPKLVKKSSLMSKPQALQTALSKPQLSVLNKSLTNVPNKPQPSTQNQPQTSVQSKPQTSALGKPQSSAQNQPQLSAQYKPQTIVQNQSQSNVHRKPSTQNAGAMLENSVRVMGNSPTIANKAVLKKPHTAKKPSSTGTGSDTVDYLEKYITNFRCRFCSILFQTELETKQHLELHCEICLSLCEYPGSHDNLHSVVINKNKKEAYMCLECGTHNPRGHFIIHNKVYDIICEICSASFTTDKSYQHHKLACPEYHCKYCGKSFPTLNHGRTHEYHSHEKQFRSDLKCPQCNKQFPMQKLLKVHVCKQCDNCGEFVDVKHQKRHVCQPMEQPIGLLEQMLRVSDYEQSEDPLGEVVDSKADIPLLIPMQTAENSFNCEVCSNSYETKELLDSHECYDAHGVRVYRCQICTGYFSRLEFIEHMKLHIV